MTSKRVIDRINNVVSNLSTSIGIVDFNYIKTFFLGMPTKDCVLQILDFTESLFLHHKNFLNKQNEKCENLEEEVKKLSEELFSIKKVHENDIFNLRQDFNS